MKRRRCEKGIGSLNAKKSKSPFARLPIRPRGKGKTTGILVVNGEELPPIVSGRAGYARNIPKGTSGFNGITRTHVEGHVAAYMRQNGVKYAVLYINNIPCAGVPGCDAMLPRMLPEGAELKVVAPNQFEKTYVGRPK